MPQFHVQIWQDSLILGAEMEIATRGASRILFVHDGGAHVSDYGKLNAGKAYSFDGYCHIQTGFKPCVIIRYEFVEDPEEDNEIYSNGATHTKLAEFTWLVPSDYNAVSLDVLTLLNADFSAKTNHEFSHVFILEGAGEINNSEFKSPYLFENTTQKLHISPTSGTQLWSLLLQIANDYPNHYDVHDNCAILKLCHAYREHD